MKRTFIDWNGSGELDPQDLLTGVAIDTLGKKRTTFSDDEIEFVKQQMGTHVSRGLGLIDIEMRKFELGRTRHISRQDFLSDLLFDVAEPKYGEDSARKLVELVLIAFTDKHGG